VLVRAVADWVEGEEDGGLSDVLEFLKVDVLEDIK
jgi:hypothetical protein